MFWLTLLSVVLGVARCARLDSLYLPPSASAYSSFGGGQSHIGIGRFDNQNDGTGNYRYAYSTGNGIQAEEQGQLRGSAEAVHGSYSYTAPNGQQISVSYTADENGFHPQGAHLPTPPPIPDAILRSISQSSAGGNYDGGYDDGQYRPNNGGYRY